MENQANSKSIILNNGLYYGLILILASLITYALGMHLDPTAGYINLGVLAFVLIGFPIIGMSKFKKDNNDFMSWLNSKALTCITLSLCLLDIVIRIFNILIHIRFTPRPCYYLFLLTICFGAAFLICWWSLTNSSIIRLQSLNTHLSNL